MSPTDVPLIDAPLAPEDGVPETVGSAHDFDLHGCRLLLLLRAVRRVTLDGTPGGAVELGCTFQPADGTRFVSADLTVRLTEPAGVRIDDLAPREVRDQNPVKYEVDAKGKLGIKYAGAEAGVETGGKSAYAVYYCHVQGAGVGTATARWTFRENPAAKDGLGRENVLTLVVPVTGPVAAEVDLSARLARPGVVGVLEAFRNLIFGPRADGRRAEVRFDIPVA